MYHVTLKNTSITSPSGGIFQICVIVFWKVGEQPQSEMEIINPISITMKFLHYNQYIPIIIPG